MKWRIRPPLSPREKAQEERDKRDRRVPKLVVPPPAIYAAAIVAGVVINRIAGWDFGGGGLRVLLGLALVALGLALSFWSIQQYRHAETSPEPKHQATALVTGGPYAYSRNPIYLASALMQAGFGVAVDMPWIVIAVLPALIVMRNAVIEREEAYLENLFGEEYVSYKGRVRRWIQTKTR